VYLNQKLSVGLAPEGLKEYATQRLRWCLGLVQICRGPSGPFRVNRGLPLSLRINLVETFLYWGVSFPFRILCLLASVAYPTIEYSNCACGPRRCSFAFFSNAGCASCGDNLARRGRILPFIADVSTVNSSGDHGDCRICTLQARQERVKVTAKGIRHGGLSVQWRLLGRFLVMALIVILGIAKVIIFDNPNLIEGGGALSLFWIWYNLAVVTLCCFVCLEQPRRRRDEQFATK